MAWISVVRRDATAAALFARHQLLFARRHLRGLSLHLTYLRFRQAQILRQRFPLRSNDVVIALERVLQFQQLRRRECRADALRLSERLQQEICK